MPKVSINILTKNRAELLKKALLSVSSQSFKDFEVIVINDGSSDETEKILNDLKIERFKDLKIITHQASIGITKSRQEALEKSTGEYIAILDDDDQWTDPEKLKKQVEYLDAHPDCVLVGGGVELISNQIKNPNGKNIRLRPESDQQIRQTMLFRNNFFTSTVIFRRQEAIKANGFLSDEDDFGEDYDLWLRLGKFGKMYNFQQPFTAYRVPDYNKEKFKGFVKKQLCLIKRNKSAYPLYYLAVCILKFRLFL